MITSIKEFKQLNENQSFKVVARDRQHLLMLITKNIEKFGYGCDLNYIDTSQITDMSGLFLSSKFNGNIKNWDVSNVTNMNSMFYMSDFNRFIYDWDVSNVTNMSHMFANSKFGDNIDNWNVSNVTDMTYMFVNSPLENKPPIWYKK